MSLLGKILALVNILAAVGFIYLAASDYGKRQQWSYAVYRHDLAINGLPLDEKEVDVDGVPLVKNLSEATKTEIFQGLGQPVKTQLEEVQRVQNQLRSKIDDGQPLTVPNPLVPGQQLNLATAEQKRVWFLLPLAHTLAEREALLTQLFQAQPNVDAAAFDKPFTDVLAKTDPGDKRVAVAELLFNLMDATMTSPPAEGQDAFESSEYKRFLTVVGLKSAISGVDSQAATVARMAQDTDSVLAAGRSAFAAQHGQLLSRIRNLADVVQRERETLAAQQSLVARQQDLVSERDRQVKELETRLAAARKTTQGLLADQDKIQQAVLEAQRKLRDANGKNQQLEKDLRGLEGQR
jgi:hypothetical protein